MTEKKLRPPTWHLTKRSLKKCVALCPSGNSTFKLEGILNFVTEEQERLHHRSEATPFSGGNSGADLDKSIDWYAIYNFLTADWQRTLLIVVFCLIAFSSFPAVVLYFFWCSCACAKQGGGAVGSAIGSSIARHNGLNAKEN